MINRYAFPATGAVFIVVLASLLYTPFLDNALVFDDHGLFSTLAVFDYAQHPFSLRPRSFPYFTFGWIQVEIGSIEAQRIANLILHILCSLMLFALVRTLLQQASIPRVTIVKKTDSSRKRNEILAALGALWFTLNPVAVYGAGYLVERTILFATLFSLISLWFFCRAFAQNRTTDIITAALFYSLAVFAKEHAILLPLSAIPISMLYGDDRYLKIKRIGLYLLLCIPAGVTVVLSLKTVVATSYEPYVHTLFSQIEGIPLLKNRWGQWFVSMTMQAGFFFDYIGYWLLPNTQQMSIDMRINFTELWSAWWLFPKAGLFLACPVLAIYLVRKGEMSALFGCGLLYSWLLFLVELTTVRFQEPFVLYRSYIWAPGYVLMVAAACSYIRLRFLILAAIPVLCACTWLSQDRLTSLESEYSVWNDAATKLQSKSMVGAARIFHMRGRAYIAQKKLKEAIVDFNSAIENYPTAADNYYQRGAAYFLSNEYAKAQIDFNHALQLNPKHGRAQYALGVIFERVGCVDESIRAFSASRELGIPIAAMQLARINEKKSKLARSAQGSCPLL